MLRACSFIICLRGQQLCFPAGVSALMDFGVFCFVLGWWLSGSGVERSQKNSRGDPGESQYSGEFQGICRLPKILAGHALGKMLMLPCEAFFISLDAFSHPELKQEVLGCGLGAGKHSQELFVALSPGVVLLSAGTALGEAFLGSKPKICACCAGGCFAPHLNLDTSHCWSTSTVIKPETFSHPGRLSSRRTRRSCGVSC